MDYTRLPPDYRILNDGAGREILSHESWEHGEVFQTEKEAVARAWELVEANGLNRPIYNNEGDEIGGDSGGYQTPASEKATSSTP